MKESIKVSLYGEALDFENIDNPLSFLLKIPAGARIFGVPK